MNNEVEKFINDNRAKGIPIDSIKQRLIANGWREEDLNNYFPANATPLEETHSNLKEKVLKDIPSISLRIGLSFVYIYAAFFISWDVKTGAKYVPAFVTSIIPLQTFLILFGVFEIFLSIWLLSGKFKLYSALTSAAFLIVITGLNYSYFDVLFRNIALIAASLALAAL